jgi:transposase
MHLESPAAHRLLLQDKARRLAASASIQDAFPTYRALAPICRKRSGFHYAENRLAPLCRKLTGSITPTDDRDETGFRADVVQGKTWGLKGRTPVVALPGKRQSISPASAVSAKGAFWFTTFSGAMRAPRFVELLKQLLRHRNKPLFVILDSLPAHKAKMVEKFVESSGGRLRLFFLPGYAPELNPDELVWNHAKRTGRAKSALRKGESLRQRVEADLTAIQRQPALLRSFFREPSVAYITD